MTNQTNNICCRVFKEQFDLIKQLPENERALVLYHSLSNAFNQFEYQNDNQIENQNENAYVSVSESVSELGKCIINLLSKNIVCKEFSNNYGGKREKAGRKKSNRNKTETKTNQDKTEQKPKENHPTIEDIKAYCLERGNNIDPNEWYDYYSANGWKVGRNPMKDWKACVRYWEQKHKEQKGFPKPYQQEDDYYEQERKKKEFLAKIGIK